MKVTVFCKDNLILGQGIKSLVNSEMPDDENIRADMVFTVPEKLFEYFDSQTMLSSGPENKMSVLLFYSNDPIDIQAGQISRILGLNSKCRVLLLTDNREMSFLLRALKSGAKGFLLTSSGSQEIIRALLSLRGGYEYFGPCLTQYLVRESLLAGPGYSLRSANENAHQKEPAAAGPDNDKPIAGGPAGEVPINNGPAVSVIPDKICKNLNMPSLERLSQREIEIMSLWGEGFSNPDISDKLCISIRTVESHKNHIMQKLNLKTNVDLIKFGIKNNIIQLD